MKIAGSLLLVLLGPLVLVGLSVVGVAALLSLIFVWPAELAARLLGFEETAERIQRLDWTMRL